MHESNLFTLASGAGLAASMLQASSLHDIAVIAAAIGSIISAIAAGLTRKRNPKQKAKAETEIK